MPSLGLVWWVFNTTIYVMGMIVAVLLDILYVVYRLARWVVLGLWGLGLAVYRRWLSRRPAGTFGRRVFRVAQSRRIRRGIPPDHRT